MKIVAISDTHGQHEGLNLPQGDVIIHAGDVSNRGRTTEVADFLHWFKQLDFKHKIFIAGNHDFFFERAPQQEIEKMIPSNVIYLNDSGVTIDGINIWGSPITPWFFDWAFNRHRGADIVKHWELIPANTDILITHGPVYGILDKTRQGKHVGCEDLLRTAQAIKPKLYLCGHIHEAYGQRMVGETHYINASLLDVNYRRVNEPVVFELT